MFKLLRTKKLRFLLQRKINDSIARYEHSKKSNPSCPQKSLMELNCKVAVVTGGSTGIGFATAYQILLEKAKSVALIGTDNCTGREAVNALNCAHGQNRAIFINCDVECEIKLNEAFATVEEECGKIDLVVNAAGIFNGLEWEKEVSTNFIGTINTTFIACKYMCSNGGLILNVSGLHGVTPFPAAPTLSGCFHGIIGFSRSMGAKVNYNRTGIRVVALLPGITHTNFIKNAVERTVSEEIGVQLERELNEANKQRKDVCGQAAIHLIKFGRSGSVWVVEGSKLYSLDIPKWKMYSHLVSQYI